MRINKAIRAAYEAVLLWQVRQKALMMILESLPAHDSESAAIRAAVDPLWNYLMKKEIEAWRSLFMWAIGGDRKWIEEAGSLARERFLTEKSSIMGYLNPSGIPAKSWFCKDEEAFRAEINRAFPETPQREASPTAHKEDE